MNDLTGTKTLTGKRVRINALKDKYFTSQMKFEKLSTSPSVQKVHYFDICGFIDVMMVVHNTSV
jgi:hypothetical protein